MLAFETRVKESRPRGASDEEVVIAVLRRLVVGGILIFLVYDSGGSCDGEAEFVGGEGGGLFLTF